MQLRRCLPTRRASLGMLAMLAGLMCGANVRAAEVLDPARLMPDSAIGYLEISQPAPLVEKLLDPALHEALGRSKQGQEYYESADFRKLKLAVGLIEARMNAKWPDVVRDLAGSLHVSFDPQTKAVLIVSRAKKAETLTKLHATLADLVELDAASKGRPSPIESKEHQGVTTWTFAPSDHHAIVDDLFIASNQSEALLAAIDRLKSPEAKGLPDVAEFQQAKAQVPSGQLAWGLLRLEPLRQLPKVEKLFGEKSNNPVAEFLAGGVLDTLAAAPVVTSSLHLEGSLWRWQTRLPRGSQPVAERRAWYFAAGTADGSLPLLRPKGTIASLSLHRDMSGLWMAREELFDEMTNAQLAQADSGLGLFFAGRDFGQQVLGELSPEWQLVVARQEFAEGQPVPAVKLPAAALVLRMKHPQEFGTQLLLTYQSIVGIVNITGLQKGQKQLLLGTEDRGGVKISKATYTPDADTELTAAEILYNASPACAQVGDRFIIGSTTGLVRDLVDVLKSPPAAAATGTDNVLLEVDVGQAAAALDDNRHALVSQNMLEEGHSREEAEREVSFLLDLLRQVQQASLRLAAEPQSIVLELTAGKK